MLNFINKRRNKKGFTLIELVVVVAILGILAAIAIPRFTGTQTNAQRKTILANLRTIDSAVTLAKTQGSDISAGIGAKNDTAASKTLIGHDYLAAVPNPVIGEVYSISGDRAVATFTNTSDANITTFGLANKTTAYTVEGLLELTGWK